MRETWSASAWGTPLAADELLELLIREPRHPVAGAEIETHRRQAAHHGDMARRMERFLMHQEMKDAQPSGDSETGGLLSTFIQAQQPTRPSCRLSFAGDEV